MKKVYIVLTHSGSILSKGIRFVKNYEYTHVSISLDKELTQMYSFGRLNPYNAFIGGFVQESPNYGTFKRFYNAKLKILSIDVTEEQYNNIKEIIKYFSEKKESYKFNFIGLLLVAFNIKFTKNNKFYCAEFIKYIFDKTKIKNNLPSLVTPNDFNYLDNSTFIYNGIIKDYVLNEI